MRKQDFRETDPVMLQWGAVGMEAESEDPELGTQITGTLKQSSMVEDF